MKKALNLIISILLLSFFCSCAPTLKSSQVKKEEPDELLAFQHFVKGEWYQSQGELDSAIIQYQSALDIDPQREEIRLALARIHYKKEDYEKALKETLSIEPKSSLIWSFLGDIYGRTGDMEKTISSYEKSIELDSTNSHSLWSLVMYYQASGQIDKAGVCLKRLTELYPFILRMRLQAASFFLKHSRYDEAERQYKKATQIAPDDRKAWLGLAETYEAKDDIDNALKAYQKALDLGYPNVYIKKRRIFLLKSQGKLKEAVSEAENLSKLTPGEEDTQKILADLYIQDNQIQKAESLLSVLKRDYSSDPFVFLLSGKAALEKKDFPSAKEDFKKTTTLNDSFPDGWIFLGLTYLEEDSTKKSIEVFKEGLGKVEIKSGLYYYLGVSHNRLEEYDTALVFFNKADSLSPSAPHILFGLGTSLERSGNYEEAIKVFEKLLQIDPENALALNYLGYMLADKGIRLDQAKVMIEKALEKDPQNPAYIDSHGWVFFRLGEIDRAEEEIQKALELLDTDAIIFEHLGDILEAKGERQKAQKYWEKALELDPENQSLKEKLNK